MKVLVAWIGGLDIDSGLSGLTGPIHATITACDKLYGEIHLLYNYTEDVKDTIGYLKWLKAQINDSQVSLQSYYIPLSSPADFGEIYLAADRLLSDIESHNPKAEVTLQITPGTPAMQAVWILLGKTKYSVEFLQSSKEQGVELARIPFDISAEFQAGATLKSLAQPQVPTHAAFDDIITNDAHMNTLKRRASVLAQYDVPVLINGASGTGKELFATAIHNASPRSGKLLKVLNCGAIPRGLIDSTLFGHKKGSFTGAISDEQGVFEAADGGTLFLDEFGELPLGAQVSLLRVLQEGTLNRVGDNKVITVDVRIICATNKDLMQVISEGAFREDLFYRIAVGVINLPSIKNRNGDLTVLAMSLLGQILRQLGLENERGEKLSPKVRNIILSHDWPGNVRELHNTLLRACLWSKNKNISESDMRDALFSQSSDCCDIMGHDLSQAIDLKGLQADLEEHYVRLAWEKTNGQKGKSAALLGMKSYQNFDKRLKGYNIK